MPETNLFSPEAAWNRAELRAGRAADRAERAAPGWREAALAAIRAYAATRQTFLAQEVPIAIPEGADARAVGAIFTSARALGIVSRDGYGRDQYGAPKTRWRSTIYVAPAIQPEAAP